MSSIRSIFSACVLATAATLVFGSQPCLASDDDKETMTGIVVAVDSDDRMIVVREIGSNEKHEIYVPEGNPVPLSRIGTFTGLPRELSLERIEIGSRISFQVGERVAGDIVARAE